MRLILDMPATWSRGRLPAGEVVRARDGVQVGVGAPAPWPDDPAGALARTVTPPGIRLATLPLLSWRTRRGVPATRVESTVAGESRLGVLLRLLDHGVIVLARGAPAALDAARAEVLACIEDARVDWSHAESVCLAHLFHGVSW